MALRQTETYDFDPITKGDTFLSESFEFNYTDENGNNPTPVAIQSVCMQLKVSPTSSVVMDFAPTFSGNVVTVPDFKVNVPGGRSYYYDIKITETSGDSFTWLKGKFTVESNISECQ